MPVYTNPPTKFDPAPEGLHQAVAVDVVDLGKVETSWGEKPMVKIVWELDVVNPNTGKRFRVSNRYNNSVDPKATLRKHLKSWRGRDFTPQELEGFDLERVIGANCQLNIVHNPTDDGRVFANVDAVVRLGNGMTPIEPSADYVREKDRTASRGEVGERDVEEADVPF